MAAFKGNRYTRPLRSSVVIPTTRRFALLGGAGVLELDGIFSPERSFVADLDLGLCITRAAGLEADTLADIQLRVSVTADLGIRVTRLASLEADTAASSVSMIARGFDARAIVTAALALNADQRQAVVCVLHAVPETSQRVGIVLLREDHLILA